MDRLSPDFYCETTDGGLAEAEAFVQNVLNKNVMLLKCFVIVRYVLENVLTHGQM